VKFHEEMKILEFLMKMVILLSQNFSAPSLELLFGTYSGSNLVTKCEELG